MFRQLARLLTPAAPGPDSSQKAAELVLGLHPMQLARLGEEVWAAQSNDLKLLTPEGLALPQVGEFALEGDSGIADIVAAENGDVAGYPPEVWDHLIYAYMVENTRVYEIFRRVLEEYSFGERLGVPMSNESQQWLRTTEQLFYRDSPPFQIFSLTSWIRPDIRAMRRNAYYRMFGLDLNHGTDDNRPYPYPRAAAANTEFAATWEKLLRETWRAIENVNNQSGPNQTDISTLETLSRALYDLLRVRRQDSGNLGRDEFAHVSTLGWLHLTVAFNTPIVRDLKAEAPSAAERIQKIGERVGLPAHTRAESYLHLAESMTVLLRALELGTFNTPTGASGLFQPGDFQQAMQTTITHWSIATGRDVKTSAVALAPPQPVAIRTAPRPIGATPSGNGAAPAPVAPVGN